VQHATLDFTAFSADLPLNTFVDMAITGAEVLSGASTAAAGTAPPAILVSVVVSAENHLSLPLLVTLLEHRLQASSSTVLSVMAPAAVDTGADDRYFHPCFIIQHTFPFTSTLCAFARYATKPLSETGHGLGFELWRAMVQRDLLQPTACDGVILVEDISPDVHSQGTKELRDFIAAALPAAVVIRLSPAGLRLDQEGLDTVQSLLQASSNGAALSERLACAVARGQPVGGAVARLPEELRAEYVKTWALSHSECPSHVGNGITTLHFTPQSLGVKEWNTHSVLRAVQAIFPAAKMVASAVEGAWKVPNMQDGAKVPRFKRLVQLATAKVLSARQEEEGNRLFGITLDRLRKTKSSNAAGDDVMNRLIRGVRSVHGTVQLSGGVRASSGESSGSLSALRVAGGTLTLEANAAFAVLRSSPSGVHREVGLTVQGVLGKQEISLLEELLSACAQYTLPRKAQLTPDQVNQADRLGIQNTPRYSVAYPLPGNWWFDGHNYVDINGTKRPLRPDIDKLVELYVEAENLKIAEYNALLELV
jgi:hypothetical protein